ncbi:hypothetical protein BC831DRAFT_152592 [Entophlyctis helioformis]|nr:hypothetical protein BC831DRAFT_152592 [Entophlyctis helioformis]
MVLLASRSVASFPGRSSTPSERVRHAMADDARATASTAAPSHSFLRAAHISNAGLSVPFGSRRIWWNSSFVAHTMVAASLAASFLLSAERATRPPSVAVVRMSATCSPKPAAFARVTNFLDHCGNWRLSLKYLNSVNHETSSSNMWICHALQDRIGGGCSIACGSWQLGLGQSVQKHATIATQLPSLACQDMQLLCLCILLSAAGLPNRRFHQSSTDQLASVA